jgi:hypothetical protein
LNVLRRRLNFAVGFGAPVMPWGELTDASAPGANLEAPPLERKLVAILAADVAGYRGRASMRKVP